jgi:hypothetical protein
MAEAVSTFHGEQVSSVPLTESGSIFDLATHAPALPEHLSKIRVDGGPIRRAGPARVGEDPRLLRYLEWLRAFDAEVTASGLEDVREQLATIEPTPVETTSVAAPVPAV